ncbi:MAG: YgjV family protein [Clostridia bacterium]|nr:YgjV family protein [Clostridia bacterium]
MTVAAWIFGIGGVVANFVIYQQKSRTGCLIAKLVADCLWTLHYGCLGAMSGAAICAIGIVRETVFLNHHRRWAKGKGWLLVFLLIGVVSAVLTWKNGFSLFPALASALSVFSFWRGNPNLTRLLSFPISGCFILYNLSCLSYMGLVNEAAVLLSSLIGLLCEIQERRAKPKRGKGQ